MNRKTPNFATQLFFQKRDLICVKEFAFGSPKFFPTEKTFLNANIMPNLRGELQAGFNSNFKQGATQ